MRGRSAGVSWSRVPMPTVEEEADVRAAHLGDQVLHFGHRVDERKSPRGPRGLRADVLQSQPNRVVGQHFCHPQTLRVPAKASCRVREPWLGLSHVATRVTPAAAVRQPPRAIAPANPGRPHPCCGSRRAAPPTPKPVLGLHLGQEFGQGVLRELAQETAAGPDRFKAKLLSQFNGPRGVAVTPIGPQDRPS